MQTKILDFDFYKSASYLRDVELNAQIYEAIHLLASLLNCVDDLILSDKCKAKIKNYKNYPQGKLWIGYEFDLLNYIAWHITVWYGRGYKSYRNENNYWVLESKIELHPLTNQLCPNWITGELIQTHRSVLIQKEIEREKKFDGDKYRDRFCKKEKCFSCYGTDYNGEANGYGCTSRDNFIEEKYKTFKHYRNLWPECPGDLSMHYNWRSL